MSSDISLGYAGFYARFNTCSKKEASTLVGPDNLVGDLYSLEFETSDNSTNAWIVNKFGAQIGYLSPQDSRSLQIYQARGWQISILLSFVAFTSTPDPGEYWGEVACICFNPNNHAAAFNNFVSTVASMLMDAIRPDISLSSDGVEHVIQSNGSWKPTARVPYPTKTTGMAILKRRRKYSENLIEAGRNKNKGCYAISIAFIVIVTAALVVLGIMLFNFLSS